MFDIIIGVLVCIGAGLFCYVSSVVVEEKKRGKRIPLFWEEDFKFFNKSDTHYRDGDNT